MFCDIIKSRNCPRHQNVRYYRYVRNGFRLGAIWEMLRGTFVPEKHRDRRTRNETFYCCSAHHGHSELEGESAGLLCVCIFGRMFQCQWQRLFLVLRKSEYVTWWSSSEGFTLRFSPPTFGSEFEITAVFKITFVQRSCISLLLLKGPQVIKTS